MLPVDSLLQQARPHALAACRRKRFLFAAYHDLTTDDLLSHVNRGLLEAIERGQGPRDGHFSTWVGMVAGRRLLDLAKVRGRGRQRERDTAISEAVHDDKVPDFTINSNESLEEWAERILDYVAAKYPSRPSSSSLTIPQRVALLAIQRRQRSSCRGLCYILEHRPSLCRTLGLHRVPSHQTISRLIPRKHSVTRKRRQSARECRITPSVQSGELITDCIRLVTRADYWRTRMATAKREGYRVTPEEAAEQLGVSVRTLAEWRRRKERLDYIKIGKHFVRYRQSDLDRLLESSVVVAVG